MRRLCAEPRLWAELRARIPPPPPGLDEHVDRLDGIYREARLSPPPPPCAPAVPLARRLHFLMVQRDSALTKLIPPGGPQ
jgi:hypothetical protein